ncbi:MAG: tRNA lysidine(34) synthetase TilS [Betaproteobacteria bacterium]
MPAARRATSAVSEIQRAVEDLLRETGVVATSLVVGLSGGLDSVVLLHCLTSLAKRLQLQVFALHVHHGLSANADAWGRFCDALCRDLSVPFKQVSVQVPRASGQGIEAAARAARYAAFEQINARAVALAHHQDDQAETLLLQLLRGAGVRGLSAMPAARVLDSQTGLQLIRPLLRVRRSTITAYAQTQGLSWVEDESNADRNFDRNFVRAEILPRMIRRYPATVATLARAARNMADAAELLDALAIQDYAATAYREDSVDVEALRKMSSARARNVLRWFIQQRGYPAPQRDQLDEALRQTLHSGADARQAVTFGDAVLRRHRGRLYLEAANTDLARDWSQPWRGEDELLLPRGFGAVRFQPVPGSGLSVQLLLRDGSVLRARSGGERIRLSPKRPSRTLKNLLQEAGLPAWQRERLPLLFAGSALVWIPDIGIDYRYAAQDGEAGVLPEWLRYE